MQDKERDKHLLNHALAKEKAIADLEEQERQARRKELDELQAHYGQQAEDKAAYEKHVEALVAHENAKQWENKEAQWRRED